MTKVVLFYSSQPGLVKGIGCINLQIDTWDVKFKLNAALGTTVEASCKGGVLEYLKVTPEWRRKDVILAGNTCNQEI